MPKMILVHDGDTCFAAVVRKDGEIRECGHPTVGWAYDYGVEGGCSLYSACGDHVTDCGQRVHDLVVNTVETNNAMIEIVNLLHERLSYSTSQVDVDQLLDDVVDMARKVVCYSDITDRDDEHKQHFCAMPAWHTTTHDDGLGCSWTDATHHPGIFQ